MFLCGQKEKLIKAEQKMEDDEVNEILREDFLRILKKVEGMYYQGSLALNDVVIEKLMSYFDPERIQMEVGQNVIKHQTI
jgi:hypothetical protein